MSKQNWKCGVFAFAAALATTAAVTAAVASPSATVLCGLLDARVPIGEQVNCVSPSMQAAPESRGPQLIRAAFQPPARRAADNARTVAPGEWMPEPQWWATLVAGLLGAGTIARRRMS